MLDPKLGAIGCDPATAHRFAFLFAHGDLNLARMIFLAQPKVRRIISAAIPTELPRQPTDQKNGSRAVAGGVFNLDRLKLFEMMMSHGMIEELREGKTEMDESNPVQVAKHD